jgi:hypothetical protein
MSEVQTSARLDVCGARLWRRRRRGRPAADLKHPASGVPLEGWTLRVRGYDSASYHQALDEQQRRRLERLARKSTVTSRS